MNDKEYRANQALSYSDLVWLEKSPLHFKNRDKLRKETEAMRLGTLLHLGVFEPERFKNAYCIEPEEIDGQPINRRVRAHRDFLAEFRKQNEGKIFIRPEDMDTLTTMFNALATHKYARQYLTGGKAEVPAFGEYQGVPIKGKCDYIVDIPGLGVTVVDLKKTQDASPKGFERSIFNYKYYLQAAMYVRLFRADTFVFIAVEDNELAPIGIYRASDVLLEKGEQTLDRLISFYKKLEQTNNWHGYTENFQDISLPNWAISEE